MIPPEADADFVAAMEDMLDVYKRPYDSRHPVICMDEKPLQLIKETRTEIPTQPGRPKRIDYEYERRGTAAIFLYTEPLAGWRKVNARERRTAQDWAQEMQELLECDYPNAEKVILVCDNLNTHKMGSFYKTFPPEIASRLRERLEIHYTPKHGSWLNIAECELSVLTRQRLDRRIPEMEQLQRDVKQWGQERNAQQKSVDWQFTTADARTKLKRLYPQIQMK